MKKLESESLKISRQYVEIAGQKVKIEKSEADGNVECRFQRANEEDEKVKSQTHFHVKYDLNTKTYSSVSLGNGKLGDIAILAGLEEIITEMIGNDE